MKALETSLYSGLVITVFVALFYPVIEKYNSFENRIYQTCLFVNKRIVDIDSIKKTWLSNCQQMARDYYSQNNFKNITREIEITRQALRATGLSHADIYTPKENNEIWKDQSLDNGIVSDYADGLHIVTSIETNSDAVIKGVRIGDEILNESLNNHNISEYQGDLEVRRAGKIRKINIMAREITKDLGPKVLEYSEFSVLKIQSFKANYWSSEKIANLQEALKSKRNIVIDLRDNRGGNFAAGLKLLSPFLCSPQVVGELKVAASISPRAKLMDDLDDELQIDQLYRSQGLTLETFPTEGCLKNPQAIIIDAGTQSTAEWVALAFRETMGVPLYGATTSGELMVSIWYDLKEIWGANFKVSIPEAYYLSRQGLTIEGTGVSPDHTIYLRAQDFFLGRDSVLYQVTEKLKKTIAGI